MGRDKSWYQSEIPAIQFHNLPASTTVIVSLGYFCILLHKIIFCRFKAMDADRAAADAFHRMVPLIYDGTTRTVSLSGWLYDMESIFQICHIEAHL